MIENGEHWVSVQEVAPSTHRNEAIGDTVIKLSDKHIEEDNSKDMKVPALTFTNIGFSFNEA